MLCSSQASHAELNIVMFERRKVDDEQCFLQWFGIGTDLRHFAFESTGYKVGEDCVRGAAQVLAAINDSGPVARRLFAMAYAQKKAALKAGDMNGGRMSPLWDRLVFSKVRARLGGAMPACLARTTLTIPLPML